ncbi:RNA-binding transcriptional accessory protein [Microaerobacter geothermalis]|uniref:Tex family protein n=1 Tax=Microaerobacter geothermalis TaxID=674972 RepID=UPI001F257B94|nr:Tex family protein [Microaerobacter geothermalis]MCF6093748.1 RNA-binding transcriptional accessory protein [Microaerobacter geothermalis]
MNQETQLAGWIGEELNQPQNKVQAVIQLLDEGNTIPFIARYRKEMTGEMDETVIRQIQERLKYLRSLEQRKQEVIKSIDEQGKLTEALIKKITEAKKLQEVEDIYLPYKPKRRTRATIAKEKGLEPLAQWLISLPQEGVPSEQFHQYINEELGVTSAEDAVQGACDIIAEWISEKSDYRQWIREATHHYGKIKAEKKKEDLDPEGIYEMYYSYEEPVKDIVPHRILAMNRGEREGVLRVTIRIDEDRIFKYLTKQVIRKPTIVADLLTETIKDAYKRLIAPAIERELRNQLTEKAEHQAILVFSENLRNLLLQPPVRGKVVLGIDPAYRTGCKLAVVDEIGKVLHIGVIYPTPPQNKKEEAEKVILRLINTYGIHIIAIGNGTASRETEQFVADVIKKVEQPIHFIIVNEAGASVYSASELAREEFPNLDVAERSAISIARRLQDPLSELVKIDPKSIGVGQYQHDVTQSKLSHSLTQVVESAVNLVGVDVNTASVALLQYISGLNKSVAQQIVIYREEIGGYKDRKDLLKVPRLGPKTYEQAIGFLRIIGGNHPLDATSVHPESYDVVQRLFQYMDLSYDQMGTEELKKKCSQIDVQEMADRLKVGTPTLRDILDSLQRPGRDPRDDLPKPLLLSDVLKLEDLYIGMKLEGTVRNVVDFGAFVDIGLKNDGLVHISQLSRQFVRHPMDAVSVGEIVTVWVKEIDTKRGRVGLTMIPPKEQ